VDLDETVRRAVNQLIVELGGIPELTSEPRARGEKVTIVISEMKPAGSGVTREDTEFALNDLWRQLNQSRQGLLETAQIVRSRGDLIRLRQQSGWTNRPTDDDPIRPGSSPRDDGPVLDPERVFFLTGELRGRQDASGVRYLMGFDLVREFDGALIWSSQGGRF
jgi:hypothetical protein